MRKTNKKVTVRRYGKGFVAATLAATTLFATAVPTFAKEKDTADVIASSIEGMLKTGIVYGATTAVKTIPIFGELLSKEVETLVKMITTTDAADANKGNSTEELIMAKSDEIVDKISELKGDIKTSKDEILTAMRFNTKKIWDRVEAADLKQELMTINDLLGGSKNSSVYKNAIKVIEEMAKPGFNERYEKAAVKAKQSATFKSFINDLKNKYGNINEDEYSELTRIIKENKKDVDFKNYIDTRLACLYSNVDDVNQSQGTAFMENYEKLSQKLIGVNANGEAKYANVFDIYSASLATKYLFNKDALNDRREFISSIATLYTKQYFTIKTAIMADIARNTELLDDEDSNSYIVESNIERDEADLAKVEKYYEMFVNTAAAEMNRIQDEETSKYVICYKTGEKYSLEVVHMDDVTLPGTGVNVKSDVQKIVEKCTEKVTVIAPKRAYHEGCEESPYADDYREHEVRTYSNYNELMKNVNGNRGELDKAMKEVINKVNGVGAEKCSSVLARAEKADVIRTLVKSCDKDFIKKLRELFPEVKGTGLYMEGSYSAEEVGNKGVKISRTVKFLYDNEERNDRASRVISFGSETFPGGCGDFYNNTHLVLCVVK